MTETIPVLQLQAVVTSTTQQQSLSRSLRYLATNAYISIRPLSAFIRVEIVRLSRESREVCDL